MESNFVDVAQVAKVCHEAARAYELTLNNKGTKSWEESDQAVRDTTMQAVLVHLNNPNGNFGSGIKHTLFANIVRTFSGGRAPVLPFRAATPQPMMSIKAGERNDPSVDIIGGGSGATQEFLDVMAALGFHEVHGSFVYNANGRAIWIDPQTGDITRQIVEQGEAIGARTKINEIRQALDLPFEVVAVVEQPNEQAS